MNKKQNGFTLIELLIGMTILVIIITTVYASYRVGLKAYQKIEKESYFNQNMRQSWQVISHDLRCAFMSSNKNIKFIGENIRANEFTSSKITFFTFLPDTGTPSNTLAEVSYYIDTDPSTPYEGLVKETNGKKQEIAPFVKSFKLRYFDGFSWKDTWGINESGQVTPQSRMLTLAVEVQVQLDDKTLTTVAPIMSN
ncbi:MAG: hypothetical protein A3J83_08800 [Elusimicrobia bacterium RIFOXYA2_FULL_40_6]|nr:MAG: hypothetical protein A3J83_08800 [Elusimicrobia bacterium RIFOXYA2_FULL_40_6]